MKYNMRVISWNMNKRTAGCWDYLVDSYDPDYVLAQEASPLPDHVKATVRSTTKKSNRTAFYSKANDHSQIKVESDNGMGILVIQRSDVFFINVYANLDFKPVDPPLLGLLAKFVSNLRRRHSAENIIIAGDFNMDRRMDENPTGSRFALKNTYPINNFFDAILDMGFFDCMRKFSSQPIQTHRNNKSIFPWEIDHMFATQKLYESLEKIEVVNAASLSDHDPIIADFNFLEATNI